MQKLVIGTRGSKLALRQTELVAEALRKAHPNLVIEHKVITTKGDVNQAPIPLDTIGKAWFTEEIEAALLRGEIDLAVHSLKDLPPELPGGLVAMPVCTRADPADVFISKTGVHLKDMPHGAVIGTDSIRRKAQLLALRPDFIVKSIRGNVDTRLRKLREEDYDAIVIAAAGIERLGMASVATERFDPREFIPAPGQAVMAAEARLDRPEILDIIRAIEDGPTARAANIEQAFSRTIGGGCKLPIAAYVEIEGDSVSIYAMVGTMDGLRAVRKTKRGPLGKSMDLAKELADEFLRDPITRETAERATSDLDV